MNKKFTSVLLILAIIIQLAVPIAMITNKMQIDKNFDEKGKEYIFKIGIRYIRESGMSYYFYDCDDRSQTGFYAVEDYTGGYSKFVYSKHIPIKKEYVKMSSFIDSQGFYEFSEELSTDYNYFEYDRDSIKGTARVKIYKGEMKVLEILIDGIPAEEWCVNKLTK